MSERTQKVGATAIATKGWFPSFKWLLARRFAQIFFIALFLAGPVGGYWIVKGTLAASMTLDVLPLTDPYVLAQSYLSGHAAEATALTGAVIVLAVYALIGGRVYCSWVCPVNIVTDAAHWLRARLGLTGGMRLSRRTRYWVLAMSLAVSLATGTIAWEMVNPVTLLFRGLLFGMGLAWAVVLAVFLFDAFAARRGWCGHLCPVGAFYSLIGSFSLLRVSARRREACDDCMDCFAVCPEPHVISPALKGAERKAGPVILSADCTNCGRCIDVCGKDVFVFTHRGDSRTEPGPGQADLERREAA